MYICCQCSATYVPAISFINKMESGMGWGIFSWDLSDEMLVQTLKI